MGDLKSNPELPVPGKHEISITGTRRVLISCQLRDHMDARFTRLRGYKDKYICWTDECGAATETKAVEENPSPKAIGFYDLFNEFGWIPSPAEDRWAILKEFLRDNCLPEDAEEQEPFMELKRELERELEDPKSKVSCNTARTCDTDHLFRELPKHLNPTDSKDPKCKLECEFLGGQTRLELVYGITIACIISPSKVFDDCFDAHIERVSLIECYTPDCLIDSADPSVSLSPHLTVSVISWAPGDRITFNPADLPPSDSPNRMRALYVTVELRGVVLSRVAVNGTVVNVMPRRTFDTLGYNQNDLSPCPLTIKGYYQSPGKPLGKVTTNVKLGILNSEVEFVVMDIPKSSYNLVLGRPWLLALRAVSSALYQKVKLPFKMGNQKGILTIDGTL